MRLLYSEFLQGLIGFQSSNVGTGLVYPIYVTSMLRLYVRLYCNLLAYMQAVSDTALLDSAFKPAFSRVRSPRVLTLRCPFGNCSPLTSDCNQGGSICT